MIPFLGSLVQWYDIFIIIIIIIIIIILYLESNFKFVATNQDLTPNY